MIGPEYCAVMARYNTWQNNSLITAADTLDDAARQQDRGAFFGSIQATFSHILWGDTIWMSRFDGWEAPGVGIRDSAGFASDWAGFKTQRAEADARIIAWADRVQSLKGDLAWFSGALGRDTTRPLAMCVAHLFNHQTHHRGQIHAMLTAAGARPDATDLFAMPGI